MPDILVRGVKDDVKERLVASASRNGRSLQAEARLILEAAVSAPSAPSAAPKGCSSPRFAVFESDGASEQRAERRTRIFAALDAVNARVDASSLPDPAEIVASIRGEKDGQDGGMVSEVLLAGGVI